jgi:hypothetical protein
MYYIVNKKTGVVSNFVKVREAARYMKDLKRDKTRVSKDEIIELCNIFAKYKNKIAIDYELPYK